MCNSINKGKNMKIEWHPLLNQKLNKHYRTGSGKTTIEDFESKHTVIKLMNWAEITADKYQSRMDHKDQKTNDEEKRQDYIRYYNMLRALVLKCPNIKEMSAEKAYKHLNIEWRYR
jgi:hypothetical protein